MPGDAAMTDFTGKVALVTGGARGLGRVIARQLARRGATVVLNYFHSPDAAGATAQELRRLGATVHLIRASVAKRPQAERMFDEVRSMVDGLDVLINNAAAGALLPDDELTERHWERAWDTNVRGSMWCAELAAPLMAARGGGAIVNLSSVGAQFAMANYVTVGTSKAAVEALTRYQAVKYAPLGIRVNTASGGLIEGGVASTFPDAESLRAVVEHATPMGRLGTEEELADVAVFLASDAARWVTGQTLLADGGLSLGHSMLSPSAMFEPRADPEPDVLADADPDAIVVVGMGVVCPGARNADEFWRLRKQGDVLFDEPGERWDLTIFHDPDPAAPDRTYSRKAGYIQDAPATQQTDYTRVWLREALEQALDGVAVAEHDRAECFLGYTADGSQHLEEAIVAAGVRERVGESPLANAVEDRLTRVGSQPTSYLPHVIGRDAVTELLPPGANVTMLDTACSSSLYAVDLGAKMLLSGRADLAVCGGAYALSPRNPVLFAKIQGLSASDQVRAFDADADGVLFADGAAVVILKRLAKAQADGDRVLGFIAGIGTSSDGRGKAIYAPNVAGQRLAISRAQDASGIDGTQVDWVLAHATGTPAGDQTELDALSQLIGTPGAPCPVTSNKSQVGHTGWAAGALSLIEALQALRHAEIPGQHLVRAPRAELTGPDARLTVSDRTAPWRPRADKPRVAAISGFGFGGTNAHVLVSDRPTSAGRSTKPDTADEVAIVAWTAVVPGGLTDDDVAEWLRGRAPAPAPSFGPEYPLPSFKDIKIPPLTLRAADRCQPMILECVSRLRGVLEPLWSEIRDTTGVFVGQWGPTEAATRYTMRCYLPWLARLIEDDPLLREDDQVRAAFARLSEEVEGFVGTATEGTLPGAMANIIPARVANYFDFHGINMAVDTGLSSSLTAIRSAADYLTAGDVDLALVCGINGNSTKELSALLRSGSPAPQLAEGAFLLALARPDFAAARGLPVLGTLRRERGSEASPPAVIHGDYKPGGRTYLGGEMAKAVIQGLLTSTGSTLLSARDPFTGTADRLVLETPQAAADAAERYAVRLKPYDHVRTCTEAEPAALAVTDDLATAAELSALGLTTLCTANGDTGSAYNGPVRRLLVVAGPDRTTPLETRLALHDAAFRVLQAKHQELTTVEVLLLDTCHAGTPARYTGLFTGLTKCLRWELPDVTATTLLTSDKELADGLRLLAGRPKDAPTVLVHDGTRMLTPVAVEQPLPQRSVSPLTSTSVVLATGGARGVTAEILVGTARTTRAHIWILGSNDLAGYPDWAYEGTEAEFAERRAEYLRDLIRSADGKPPAEARAHVARLVAARAAKANLARMAQHSGDHVHYLCCDVTDQTAVHNAVQQVLAAEGRVDLVIHGAGVNRSGSLRTKRFTDFQRVRDVKVLGYHHLDHALRDKPAGLWCNLGSVVGFSGLPGEFDYCSGNDFLASAARDSDRPEVTIAWPLWRSVGFAAERLTSDFLERQGLSAMETDVGVARFLAEIAAPRHEPNVLYLDPGARRRLHSELPASFSTDPVAEPAPLLGSYQLAGTTLECARTVDLTSDNYLADHLVRGVPAMPGAFMAEIAAQAAHVLCPDKVVTALTDIQLLAFLRTRSDRPTPIRVEARLTDEGDVHVALVSDLYSPKGVLLQRDKPHFAATVRLAATYPAQPAGNGHRPGDNGIPARDPYLLPNPFLQLTGIFRTTKRGRITVTGPAAEFRLPDAPLPAGFPTFRTPAVLLDGLLRVAALTPEEYPGPLAAPSAIERIDLHDGRNDLALAAAYPDGVTIQGIRGGGEPLRLLATASDGRVLMSVSGLTTVSLGKPAVNGAGRPQSHVLTKQRG